MSTAEKTLPMTEGEWKATMAEIHAKLDSIPEEMPRPARGDDIEAAANLLIGAALWLAAAILDGHWKLVMAPTAVGYTLCIVVSRVVGLLDSGSV